MDMTDIPNAQTAKDLTAKAQNKSDFKNKEYEKLTKYVYKEILKESKKGRDTLLLTTTYNKENLGRLEKQLTELGYKVVVFIDDYGCYEVRISWSD